jgi:hypothetical protein
MTMASRKPGQLLEIFGDFWLGVAGAGAEGFAQMTKKRREEKNKPESTHDFFENAADAAQTVFKEALSAAQQTAKELKDQVKSKT